jgi:hypothetical protein
LSQRTSSDRTSSDRTSSDRTSAYHSITDAVFAAMAREEYKKDLKTNIFNMRQFDYRAGIFQTVI